MSIKISQLPAGTTPTGTELVPAVQSATTVALTVNQILSLITLVGLGGTTLADVEAVIDAAYVQGYVPQSYIGQTLFPRTAAETAAGVTPTNYAYAPGVVDRYGTNTTPGTTDMASAIINANAVAAHGGTAVEFAYGAYYIGSAVTISTAARFRYGASLKVAASITATFNCSLEAGPWSIFNLAASGAAIAGVIVPVNQEGAILAEWFGAAGNGTTDDSGAITTACLTAYNSGCIPVQLLAKNYLISSSVYIAGSSSAAPGNLPTLLGTPGGHSGTTEGTRITLSGAITGIIVNAAASAQLDCEGIRDIVFVGNGTDIAVQLSGSVAYDVVRCTFKGNKIGLQWYNATSNQYTEYCRAIHCWFYQPVDYAVNYLMGSGASSFHGSGLEDCYVNLSTDTASVVNIGAGAIVYNAPMSFQAWCATPPNTLIVNSSGEDTSLHGTITVEGGSAADLVTVVGGTTTTLYAGKFLLNSTGVVGGTNLALVQVANTQASAVIPYWGRKTTFFACGSGTTAEANKPPFYGAARLVHVAISNSANTYDFRAILMVIDYNNGGAGAVTVLMSELVNNSAAYGAPTFGFANDGFEIINSSFPTTGVAALCDHTQISGPVPYNQAADYARI